MIAFRTASFRQYIVAAASIALTACSASAVEMRGIWVECQGSNDTLSSKKKIEDMVNRVSSADMNTIFLQVHRGNRAWFRSSFADTGPCDDFVKKNGCDPLSYAIDQAHARGLKLHAWINVFRILKNRNAPILKRLGESAVTCDGTGKSMLSYPPDKLPNGLAGYWLDPGDERVREYLLGLVDELVRRYPKLDGIHLDFVRYPSSSGSGAGSFFSKGKDFGYGPKAVEAFKARYGLNPLTVKKTRENCDLWDGWRRDNVTDFVTAAGKRVRGIDPAMQVSAAVFAYAGRAYSSYFQDWRRWMEEGLLDFVVPMNYNTDSRRVKYQTQVAVSSAGKGKVYIGLGAYMLTKKPEVLLSQIRDAMGLGAGGVVLFSYDAMLKSPPLFPLLRQRVFSTRRPAQAKEQRK